MKKVVLVLICVMLVFCSCSNKEVRVESSEDVIEPEELTTEMEEGNLLIGYWVSGDLRYSLSFGENNKVVVDDKYIGVYEIYNENRVVVNVGTDLMDDVYDTSVGFTFSIADSILCLTDSETGEDYYFFTEEKANSVVNSECLDRFNIEGPVEIYEEDYLGYYDEENNIVKDFDWSLDSDSSKKDEVELLECWEIDKEIFEDKVLSTYKNFYSGDSFSYDKWLVGVQYEQDLFIEHVIELRMDVVDASGLMGRFIVSAESGDIFKEVNTVEGIYRLWDGMVVPSKSVLKKI